MRLPIWLEHPRFFRGALPLLASLRGGVLAGGPDAIVSHGTGLDARTGPSTAMTATTRRRATRTRDVARLAEISRTGGGDPDEVRAEILEIADRHNAPAPDECYSEEQQARMVLAQINPTHRELIGEEDDDFNDADFGLPTAS